MRACWHTLWPHARRLHLDTAVTVRLLDRVARYLLARGRVGSAAAVMGQALSMAEQLGHEDPAYLSCRNTYGLLLLARGDFPAARTVCEEVYQARTQILGVKNPETLRAGRDLVEALYRQGDWTQAAHLQDQLVEAFTAILGPDDLETLTSRAYQAMILQTAGHHTRARTMQEQVLEARSRVLGEDHRDTLSAMTDLALTLYAQGNKEASALLNKALNISLRAFGKKHTVTTEAAWRLAQSFEPHEADRRRAFIMMNLSWLGSAPSDKLTAVQKEIRNGLTGVVHSKKPANRKKKRK